MVKVISRFYFLIQFCATIVHLVLGELVLVLLCSTDLLDTSGIPRAYRILFI